MAKRMIVMLAVVGALIATLAFVKFRQFQEFAAQAAAFQPPPEAVTTIVAQQEKWPAVTDLKNSDGQTYRGVRQQFVRLGDARGDQIAVLSGLNPGEEVVTSGVFKLRNGAAVVINNKVQPSNERAPKPEDS